MENHRSKTANIRGFYIAHNIKMDVAFSKFSNEFTPRTSFYRGRGVEKMRGKVRGGQ
jgi:hypothetical protein